MRRKTSHEKKALSEIVSVLVEVEVDGPSKQKLGNATKLLAEKLDIEASTSHQSQLWSDLCAWLSKPFPHIAIVIGLVAVSLRSSFSCNH